LLIFRPFLDGSMIIRRRERSGKEIRKDIRGKCFDVFGNTYIVLGLAGYFREVVQILFASLLLTVFALFVMAVPHASKKAYLLGEAYLLGIVFFYICFVSGHIARPWFGGILGHPVLLRFKEDATLYRAYLVAEDSNYVVYRPVAAFTAASLLSWKPTPDFSAARRIKKDMVEVVVPATERRT